MGKIIIFLEYHAALLKINTVTLFSTTAFESNKNKKSLHIFPRYYFQKL
jgi:hypothetical protein